jgi:hypothetical protein
MGSIRLVKAVARPSGILPRRGDSTGQDPGSARPDATHPALRPGTQTEGVARACTPYPFISAAPFT